MFVVAGDRLAVAEFFQRGRGLFGWHAVLFVDPGAEVEQLASFGTEGSEGVVLPLNWLLAVGTFHGS